jgi:hypothetical protein
MSSERVRTGEEAAMQYLVRVDGEPGPRGGRSTSYPTQAAAALAVEQELARLRARGAVIVSNSRHDHIVAYTPDGPPTILHLAVEHAP